MKVDGSIGSVLQGVSQQPERERLKGQCTRQVNMMSDLVRSLTDRPPTEFIAKLGLTTEYTWDRFTNVGGEVFFLATAVGELRVFDTKGVERAVSVVAPATLDYITGGTVGVVGTDGDDILERTSVTYISDTGNVVKMLDELPEYHTGDGIVFMLGGQYGRNYNITITYDDADGTDKTFEGTYTTPDGSTSAHITYIATDYILSKLAESLGETMPAGQFALHRDNDVLHVETRADVTNLRIAVDDGDGGVNLLCVTDFTDDAGKLPRFAPHKFYTRVSGTKSSDADDYYMYFVVDDDPDSEVTGAGFGRTGMWRECTVDGEQYKLDPATMPHTLTQVADGSFEFAQVDWEARPAGDDELRPPPSFLGKPIEDVSIFQSRLVFASGDSIILSRTNIYRSFWQASATLESDDGPVDISSTAKDLGTMRKLVPFNRDLVVFSDSAQFVCFGRTNITPKNAALPMTCSFEAELAARPVPAGRNVFFAINSGRYTGIKELYTDGSEDVNDSRPVTSHVAKFISGKVRHISASSNFDLTLVLAEGDRKTVYVYKYVWVNKQKMQSSWSTWTFSDDVLFTTFDESIVYLLMQDATGAVYLASMELDLEEEDGLTYTVLLDGKVYFDSVATSVTMPYACSDRQLFAVQGAGCPHPGLSAVFTCTGDTLTFQRDMLGGTVIVGERYKREWEPTRPTIRDQEGEPIGTGRFVLSSYKVQYENTGAITATVYNKHRDTFEVKFTGRVLGSINNALGKVAIEDEGTLDVPFGDYPSNGTVVLSNDTHLPMQIMDVEWVGRWVKRGQRKLTYRK